MLDLVAEAAGGDVLILDLEGRAVAVLRAHAHGVGTGDNAPASGQAQAALQAGLLALSLDDLGVHELDDLALAVLHDAHAAQDADLRRGKPDAAGLLQRFTHIVQQQVQTLIELRHRVADLLQARVTFFSDLTNGHSSSSYCIALQSAKMSRPRFSLC